jgi:hypothetical protein
VPEVDSESKVVFANREIISDRRRGREYDVIDGCKEQSSQRCDGSPRSIHKSTKSN